MYIDDEDNEASTEIDDGRDLAPRQGALEMTRSKT